MAYSGYRWEMTAPDEPLARTEFPFEKVKVEPFVEQHAFDDINKVFQAVHAGMF